MNPEQMVSTEIARRLGKRATGAIKGIRKPVPPRKRGRKPTDMSAEAVAKRAKNRRYYARNKERITAAQRLARKVRSKRTYVYFPSIHQAKDIRLSADKLAQYRNEVTASLQVWDDNHARNVARSPNEQAIDIALQAARRPLGQHFSLDYRTRVFDAGPVHAGIDLGPLTDTMHEVLSPLPR